jgi:bidirectional [NiFe] hydrogenase diaphorase subunit
MTLHDLQQIKAKELAARKKITLRCCMAAGCMSSDAKGVKQQLEKAVAERVGRRSGSARRRLHEALLRRPAGAGRSAECALHQSHAENAPSIVAALKGGEGRRFRRPIRRRPSSRSNFGIVLANSGVLIPRRIESYIAADGYQALHRGAERMTPKDVVETMTKSGLRGRGGAGFPTGLKWGTVAKSPGAKKYVICNADEGDPGAFMDRSVLESDPHSVLEGMAIAAYAVGRGSGVHLRARRVSAGHRAVADRHQAGQANGRAGRGIFESPFASTSTSASARARSSAARKPR